MVKDYEQLRISCMFVCVSEKLFLKINLACCFTENRKILFLITNTISNKTLITELLPFRQEVFCQ